MALLGNILSGRGVRPEGRDDYYTIGEDDSAELRPTDNDVSNHPLFPYWKEITSVDLGDFLGTVEIIGAEARYNQLRITPGSAYDYLGEGESETVEIGYTFRNAWGTWHEATIYLTIEGENDAPDAQDIDLFVTEDEPHATLAGLTINPVFTDPDVNDTHTIAIESDSNAAFVDVNPDGTISYYTGTFDYLAEGETATDTFTYSVTDNHGGTDTATVTIHYTGVNDAPSDPGISLRFATLGKELADGAPDEGTGKVRSTYTAEFFDIDLSDTHTFIITPQDGNDLGTIVDVTTGPAPFGSPGFRTVSITVEVDDAALDYLAEGEELIKVYDLFAVDNHGATGQLLNAFVRFEGTNDAPEAQGVSATVSEDGPAIALAASFSDVDLADTHTVSIDTSATLGSVTSDGLGGFTYDPNGQFESLAAGETATDSFTYTVDDGNGGTSTNTVTVTVLGQNDAPQLTITDTIEFAENTVLVAPIPGTIIDPDGNSSTVGYEIVGGPDGALFEIFGGFSIRFSNPQDFENFGDADMDGQYLVDLVVRDDAGAVSNTQTLLVQLTDVDEGPQPENLLITFDELSVFETFGNTIYQDFFWTTTGSPLSAEDWDSDGDLEGFSGLTTVAFERIDGADFDLNALELGAGVGAGGAFGQPTSITIRGLNNGTVAHSVTLSAVDLFDFQLSMTSISLNFTGIDRVEIQTTDGFSAIDNVDVDVLPAIPNTAPVFDADDIINTPEKDFSVAAYSSTITDPDLADTHTYQIAGGADAGAFTINANTGALTFKELPDFELPGDANGDGLYEINLTVTDLSGAVSNAEAVIIQVTDVEPEPLVEVPLFVDFEDLALGTTLGTSGGEFYEGFLWSTDSFELTLQQDLNNGGVEALGQGFVTYEFERADGTDFDFLSAEFSSGFDGFDANTIVVVGYDDGVQVFSDTYIRGFDYDPFVPGPIGIGALSVDRVEIQADGLFTMDDMSFEVLV